MSIQIKNIDQLQDLVQKFGLKINSIDELTALLETIDRKKDPEAQWTETAQMIGLGVPMIMGICSFLATMFVGAQASILIIVWGASSLVCIVAVLASVVILFLRPTRTSGSGKAKSIEMLAAEPPTASRAESASSITSSRNIP